MFNEYQISTYGSESDSTYGSNAFTYLTTAMGSEIINVGGFQLNQWIVYQPGVSYYQNEFLFNPQIWVVLVDYITGTPAWQDNVGDIYNMGTPSNLPNYIVLTGVNIGALEPRTYSHQLQYFRDRRRIVNVRRDTLYTNVHSRAI